MPRTTAEDQASRQGGEDAEGDATIHPTTLTAVTGHQHRYPGPPDPRVDTRTAYLCLVTSAAVLDRWLTNSRRNLAEPHTFIIDLTGQLRLAPRRNEHVACTQGQPVLSAGEMTFHEGTSGWYVTEVTNQSTG